MTSPTDQEVVLMGVGDIGPMFEPIAELSTLVRPILQTADIRIAQCERIYSTRGSLQVNTTFAESRISPGMSSVFSDCGFDVVSLAGNHAMDWGDEGLLDTIEVLQKRGIKTVGAGRNLAEARQPVILERKGLGVAVLAYCSVLPDGHAAGPNKAGVSPLRAHTYYEAHDNQPGTPPNIVTIPDQRDLEAMVADIASARKEAHVVVLMLHWGIHFIPRMIADYQPTIAKAAFAAGADLILGHHAHAPKAIGVYDNKVCFFSLSNFIMSTPEYIGERLERRREVMENYYGVTLDPEFPRFPYGTNGRRGMIARAQLNHQGVRSVSFIPTLIDKQLRPEPLKPTDPRFEEHLSYMEWLSKGFDHRFEIQGDEVFVAT